jgi:hypothetical protein
MLVVTAGDGACGENSTQPTARVSTLTALGQKQRARDSTILVTAPMTTSTSKRSSCSPLESACSAPSPSFDTDPSMADPQIQTCICRRRHVAEDR